MPKPDTLRGLRVAIIASEAFEESELFSPKEAVEALGAEVDILSLETGSIQGYKHLKPGRSIDVDQTLDQAKPETYDALILPGGTVNADTLRVSPAAQRFVREAFEAGKPVAAICHAPWILIDAGVVNGRTLTSYQSLRHDLQNAGAQWQDADVVVDGNLITSRKPQDLPAFNARIADVFAQAVKDGHLA